MASPSAVVDHLEINSCHTNVEKFIGFFLLLFRSFATFYSRWFYAFRIRSYITEHNIQSVILNDVTSWPLACLLPPGISIMDAHEYSPQELSDSLLWTLFLQPFKLWCSHFAPLGVTRFCVEEYLCDLWYRFSGCHFKYFLTVQLLRLLPNLQKFPVFLSVFSIMV